jgi:hypothetical protein
MNEEDEEAGCKAPCCLQPQRQQRPQRVGQT